MGLRPHVHCESRTSELAKDRKFDPSLRYRDDVKLDDVEVGSYDEEWTYVACDEGRLCPHCDWLAPHVDCIVIVVDGACEGNGMTGARAAAGVFVGKTSQYNKSVLLAEPNATNQGCRVTGWDPCSSPGDGYTEPVFWRGIASDGCHQIRFGVFGQGND